MRPMMPKYGRCSVYRPRTWVCATGVVGVVLSLHPPQASRAMLPGMANSARCEMRTAEWHSLGREGGRAINKRRVLTRAQRRLPTAG